MQAASAAATPARRYRAIEPIDGYIHKFRLEACEEAATQDFSPPSNDGMPTLLGVMAKFVAAALGLSGLLAIAVRAVS
jgi:hypothetical protein